MPAALKENLHFVYLATMRRNIERGSTAYRPRPWEPVSTVKRASRQAKTTATNAE